MQDLLCRDGDLAVITRDEPGLQANVGRLVWVYGPVRQDPELGAVWEILPASDEPMAYVDEKGAERFDREGHVISHPDAWLAPVSMPAFAGRRPARVIRAVPLTREWLESVANSPDENIYLQLPALKDPATPSLTGRQLRARLRSELCIPVQEDYGYAEWLWFPGRSLSATAHWWVHEGTPEMVGKVYLPGDDGAWRIYRELEQEKSLPWVFADGQWNTYMVLPSLFRASLVPRFARGTISVSDACSVKSMRANKNGSVFRWLRDHDQIRANWRISEQVAESSQPERFLDDLLRALRQKKSPLPVLNA